MSPVRLTVGLCLAVGLLLTRPAPARAGVLAFTGAQQGGIGGLNGAEGLAVSPDGASLYVAGADDDAVAVFRRDLLTGALAFVEVQRAGAGGIDGLRGPQSVAISPDGAHVYVVTGVDRTLAVFRRDAKSGALALVEVKHDGVGGVAGLGGAEQVVLSPDGAHLYVASDEDDAVAVFRRDPTTGAVTFVEAQRDGVGGVDGLERARAVAISPDGAHVYVAAALGDAVVVFRRNPETGALQFLRVLRDGVGGVDGLDKARGVAVSPDGAHVYVVSGEADALAVFRRDPATGDLTFVEVQRDGVGGVDGLDGAQAVVVAPDGTHVYATGELDHSLAVFDRDRTTGKLTFVEAHRDGVGGTFGMKNPQPVAVSPDGSSVYVGSQVGDAVAAFRLTCHQPVCDPATQKCSLQPMQDGAPCDDGDTCTRFDSCKLGVCVGAERIACVAQDPCHDAVCDGATGACSTPPRPDGTPCDDGNACTRTDTCTSGVCTGSQPILCRAKDQCHEAGVCDPETGLCSNRSKPAKPDGTACDDGNACTEADACLAGVCTGTNPVECPPSDQCHEAGVCDPAIGLCSNPLKADGATCDDGNACTRADACREGTCTGSNPVACTAADQCHDAGGCDPVTGLCSNPSKPTGTPCDDGNACTRSDTCTAGTCTGTDAIVCTAPDPCHEAGVCDPTNGRCFNPPKADGTPCDDGNACTQTDACLAGACTGGRPVVCSAQNQCHDAGVCNTASGACSNPAKPDGSPCDDGNACSQSDTCIAGTCTGTRLIVCRPPDQCHDAGACDPATGHCSNPAKPNGTSCDDHDACTRSDTCTAGTCTGTDAIACPAPDQCHQAGVCDPATGHCSNPPKADGTACNDANACTRVDTCSQGVCSGANPLVCTAGDQCHDAGACDPKSGLCSNPPKPDGATCDDGNACTRSDRCTAGACTVGDPVVCTAPDDCHEAGVCDHETGRCSNPPRPDGTECDDGNACTRTDTCVAGACTGTDQAICSPQDQCHDAGTCDLVTGRCSNPPKPDGTACDDGNPDTTSDACVAGTCSGEVLPARSALRAAFITNFRAGTVSVIDTDRDVVTTVMRVGRGPWGVAVHPSGNTVYTTNRLDGTVSVIDIGRSSEVSATVPVGRRPLGVAAHPGGRHVYVANYRSDTLSVIDTATRTVAASVRVGRGPAGVVVDPTGARVFVTNYRENTVSLIDAATNTVEATVPVGRSPLGIAVGRGGTRIYVANYRQRSVAVVDPAGRAVTGLVRVGRKPLGLAIDSTGSRLYVANAASRSVSIIDLATNRVTEELSVGGYPFGVAVDSIENVLYVANAAADAVTAIDLATNRMKSVISVGHTPVAVGDFITRPTVD